MRTVIADRMSPKTKEKALAAIDGMAQIVKAEMLVRGVYVELDVDESKSDSVCGGHRYCAVGALWAGAGMLEPGPFLPGVESGDRLEFLRHRYGLRAAYDALNVAARNYAIRHRLNDEYDIDDLEGLFEDVPDVGRDDLLKVIASAKRKVRAA